jgi:hypothetical protein
MVTTIGRTWVRQDTDPRPLLARWQDVSDELAKLGGQVIAPASEIAIQDMQATIRQIERERAAAEVPDERLVAASRAFRDSCHSYRHVHTAITESQQKLRHFADDPICRLLFDMTAALQPPVPTQDLLDRTFGGRTESSDLYHLRRPVLPTVESYRAATGWMNDRIFELQRQQDAISAVSQYGSEEIGSRTHRMVAALIGRIEHIERRQTAAIAALAGRLDQTASLIEAHSCKRSLYPQEQEFKMKGIPLRDWGSASYDPRTGRTSSAFVRGATTIEGEHISRPTPDQIRPA